jgi:hypothetical protein
VVTAVADEEALHPGAVGQPRQPHVEKHPVDALDLEHRVIGQDIAGTARYGHDRAPVRTGGRQRPTSRVMRFIHPIDTFRPGSSSRPNRSPQSDTSQTPIGMGRSPASDSWAYASEFLHNALVARHDLPLLNGWSIRVGSNASTRGVHAVHTEGGRKEDSSINVERT